MKKTIITIILLLASSLAMPTYAQELTEAEIGNIRAAYRAAKEQIDLNERAPEQNVPRSDMQVVSHYVIPGCGPTEEVIHYHFKLSEDTILEIPYYKLFFITRSYNVAALKYYQEFLFDEQDEQLLFFFQQNDAMDGSIDETRYYYSERGVHRSIKGNIELDEVFAARLADELRNAFNLLMNRES